MTRFFRSPSLGRIGFFVLLMIWLALALAVEAWNVTPDGVALATVSEADESQHSDEELVKKLNNPVSALISVPFQNNFEFKLGPNNNGFKYTLNFQPVIPFTLNKDWNLITRTIIPIIDQNDVIPHTSQAGLGDITQSFFFSPRQEIAGVSDPVGSGGCRFAHIDGYGFVISTS
jgi:hypothetical protein